MHISRLLLSVSLLFSIQNSTAQDLFTEVGVGIGNVIGEEHSKGKAEIFLNVLKSLKYGEIGLDISTGGNFIPGNLSGIEDDIEILSPNDAKFTSLTAFIDYPYLRKYTWNRDSVTLLYFIMSMPIMKD